MSLFSKSDTYSFTWKIKKLSFAHPVLKGDELFSIHISLNCQLSIFNTNYFSMFLLRCHKIFVARWPVHGTCHLLQDFSIKQRPLICKFHFLPFIQEYLTGFEMWFALLHEGMHHAQRCFRSHFTGKAIKKSPWSVLGHMENEGKNCHVMSFYAIK